MRFADTTRGGQPVRILCTDRVNPSNTPIVALVKLSGGFESVHSYPASGLYYNHEQSQMDLVPVTPELNKTYNGGHYKVLIHDPDLNPNHPWAVVALSDNYLFWVDDRGVSEGGFIKLDL